MRRDFLAMRVAVKSDLLKRDGLKAGHLFEHRRIGRDAEVQLYRVSETHVFRRQRSVVLHGHYGEVFGSAAQLGFLVGADDALTAITLTGSSSNQAVIPDSAITFGAVGTTGRTITATDPGGTSATMTWNVTVNAVPVLTMSTKTTPENVPIDIDLRTFASDDPTPLNGIHFELSLAKKGSVVLLPDGHTARFTPNANSERWFDGQLDDVMLQSGVSTRKEIVGLAHYGAMHFNGLSAVATVNVTVTGTNQPPTISAVPDAIIPIGVVSAALPFFVDDGESEDRTVTASGRSSNTTVLPAGSVSVSGAPAAWTSGTIGNPGLSGAFLEDHGVFTISGSGTVASPFITCAMKRHLVSSVCHI